MGTLRYVKTPAELQEAAENNLEFFDATMQAVKVFYKTTPGLIEQLIPAPLAVADDPMVRIVMSRVFVDLHDGLEFGAATFGVNCKYKIWKAYMKLQCRWKGKVLLWVEERLMASLKRLQMSKQTKMEIHVMRALKGMALNTLNLMEA